MALDGEANDFLQESSYSYFKLQRNGLGGRTKALLVELIELEVYYRVQRHGEARRTPGSEGRGSRVEGWGGGRRERWTRLKRVDYT